MITLQNLFDQDKMVLITEGENKAVQIYKSVVPTNFYYEVDVKDLNGDLISLLISKGIYLYKFPILVWKNGFFESNEISESMAKYLMSEVCQKTGKFNPPESLKDCDSCKNLFNDYHLEFIGEDKKPIWVKEGLTFIRKRCSVFNITEDFLMNGDDKKQ